jgi:hypothetical protein
VIGSVTDLNFIEEGAINFAFASNLFEHLSKPTLRVLETLRHKLASNGTKYITAKLSILV